MSENVTRNNPTSAPSLDFGRASRYSKMLLFPQSDGVIPESVFASRLGIGNRDVETSSTDAIAQCIVWLSQRIVP